MEDGAVSQECRQPLEAGKGKNTEASESLQKEHRPADLILAQEDLFWTF